MEQGCSCGDKKGFYLVWMGVELWNHDAVVFWLFSWIAGWEGECDRGFAGLEIWIIAKGNRGAPGFHCKGREMCSLSPWFLNAFEEGKHDCVCFVKVNS